MVVEIIRKDQHEWIETNHIQHRLGKSIGFITKINGVERWNWEHYDDVNASRNLLQKIVLHTVTGQFEVYSKPEKKTPEKSPQKRVGRPRSTQKKNK